MTVLVGTSGWQYRDWHETFYPHGTHAANWLSCYARHFGSEDVFVLFNDDTGACALRDARWFAQACLRRGLETTRIPGAREVAPSECT